MKTLRMFILIAALLFSLTGCARGRLADTSDVFPPITPPVISTAASTPAPDLQYTFDR